VRARPGVAARVVQPGPDPAGDGARDGGGRPGVSHRRARGDPRPLDEESSFAAAREYSRAYLHHLVRANEMLGGMLLSAVNLAYYQQLMAGMRDAIAAHRFEDFGHDLRENWRQGDLPPL
jgi:queuine tRNA-ribosyltransferase